MAIVLALGKLFDDVKAQFVADGLGAIDQTFGWREPNRQLGSASRITWAPGDESGNAGEDAPPKYPGRLVPGRPLGTLLERCTVTLTGFAPNTVGDKTISRNERAQWQATRELYDAWRRAVYLAAHGTIAIKSTRWEVSKNEFRFGAALVVVLTVESMIPDAAPVGVPADAHVALTTTELNVAEFEVINPVP